MKQRQIGNGSRRQYCTSGVRGFSNKLYGCAVNEAWTDDVKTLRGVGRLVINKPEPAEQWTVDKLSYFPSDSISKKSVAKPKTIFRFPEALTN
ncbi:hypothetical protein QE152_g15970 [Popillia japonica]|uniref:Uncharacterized protein n=1 Tax=Popillia japonica TaxID=7064 RepID=A0AAW1L642_POPJA